MTNTYHIINKECDCTALVYDRIFRVGYYSNTGPMVVAGLDWTEYHYLLENLKDSTDACAFILKGELLSVSVN